MIYERDVSLEGSTLSFCPFFYWFWLTPLKETKKYNLCSYLSELKSMKDLDLDAKSY